MDNPADRGVVWLVGAGPGDPGLLTLKGRHCIAEADVIVYDYLSNPALLAHARADAEIIYAGKQAARHAMEQDEINALLCEKALEGKRICRLKGGDPFVFGRGGEEALYLVERGVPFEVVPGVSSAIAAPAYAGIPVTHRECASSVRIITGHEDPTKPESSLDWREIAATSGTLVFLMGIRNISQIAEHLITGGRPASTPAAVITNGTLPTQRTVAGTLADIAQRAETANIAPPGLLVVGEVAALRERLNWFERRSLFGRAIVVTRARAQASDLAELLESMGAEVITAPSIRTESLADTPAMREAAAIPSVFDWLVFTSVNGVDAFFEALELEGKDARALAGVKIASIGPATAMRLMAKGIRPDLTPQRYIAEAILEELDKTEAFQGQRYLLPRSELARIDLADGLRARGAEVCEAAAYKTLQADALPESLLERLEMDDIDLVTFTSSSTVTNFVELIPMERREAILPHVRAASIGPITSHTLTETGIAIATVAKVSTIPGLAVAIRAYIAGRSH